MNDGTKPIDPANTCMVSARGELVVLLRPPRAAMTRAQALTLAAWLVAVAEDPSHEFQAYLEAVLGT